ncbi:tetratricopeptide repeat protein [Streptomyces sp. TP-A0874]|uniref:tetratricopeptide repeat protein n=1 Tax=Streptomyces sp. TP-A0874 TaxID=549819 RepID=UPI000852E397|nr:tetratricopeptide repeat protein [Streptomyces sp. TP-A0874]
MSGSRVVLRSGHRAEAEQLLLRSVEEEARRSRGRSDSTVLLARAREALDEIAGSAAEEYAAYVRALEKSAVGVRRLAERLAPRFLATPAVVTGASAATALCADLGYGAPAGQAFGVGAAVAAAGALATVVGLTAGHWPSTHRSAALRNQPGGAEQLRLQWLTALEVRGIRPFLDRQRMLSAAVVAGSRGSAAGSAPKDPGRAVGASGGLPAWRRSDKSAAARRRMVLEHSFGHLPGEDGPFVGRRAQLLQIAQWVHASRASTETKPTVVVLHGPPGSGRSTLAVRAARYLRDQFRGACLVDLRGVTRGQAALPTRDALLHLLNRLGAPREQLLFRERSSSEQQLNHLTDLYRQHVKDLPVTIILDDASDATQVRALLPEGSESLLLVTSAEPLELPDGMPARVHELPVSPLGAASSEELLNATAQVVPEPYDAQSSERIRHLCGGLPLALRITGSSLGDRTPGELAEALGRTAPQDPVQRALRLRYADQPEQARALLRRLSLAGRASLGAAAAAALLDTDQQEAEQRLTALAKAGLLEHVRASRYRLHDLVRDFAHARLLEEDEPAQRSAAHERLINSYADLANSVIRLVDGKTSTRADHAFQSGTFGPHGFTSLNSALRWLDEESSFITAELRHAENVDQAAVLHLLGALCDYCLLRGDLYRLGELNELSKEADRGLLVRSVQWRTGIAARQLGELDTARTTLSSVVDLYFEAEHPAGAARALRDLGITLHHQGNLPEAGAKLREAVALQSGEELAGDRAWSLHALAAVQRDRAQLPEAFELLRTALELHRRSESLHGQAWAHFQLGQAELRLGRLTEAEREFREALERYQSTRDERGVAWALTQLARARLVAGDAGEAVDRLRQALARHRNNEDARGEAWTMYYLGQAVEESGDRAAAIRELEGARTMFSRMRDGYGLACARHHSARATRDQRAAQTGSLRNSGFARQMLQDARQDFHRMGVQHGEAWSCLELAVIDAGNGRPDQALELVDEAARLFAAYGDGRGRDWAGFLRCTLLPFASPGGSVVGAAVAQEELAQLLRAPHPAREPRLSQCAEAFAVILERGVEPETGWQAWDLGMVPGRHSRDVMGVAVSDTGDPVDTGHGVTPATG